MIEKEMTDKERFEILWDRFKRDNETIFHDIVSGLVMGDTVITSIKWEGDKPTVQVSRVITKSSETKY